jgi:hypothetical protein
MKVDTQITLSVEDTDINVNGYCRDLSGTGMLIEVKKEVDAGATCKTTLPSTNDAFPALDAKVKIIRCTQVDDNTYHLGTEILEIAS